MCNIQGIEEEDGAGVFRDAITGHALGLTCFTMHWTVIHRSLCINFFSIWQCPNITFASTAVCLGYPIMRQLQLGLLFCHILLYCSRAPLGYLCFP